MITGCENSSFHMELVGQKKVHLIPMGFEIDRIELPLHHIGTDMI
jgi:hypothetical protein